MPIWLLTIFGSRIGRMATMIFGGIGLVLAVILGAQRLAVKRDRAERESEALRDSLKTRERIDDALAQSRDDPRGWHDKLSGTRL